jgi:uncharacterized phiE125 gp8 family phage protein
VTTALLSAAGLKVITPPTQEPVTLALVRSWLRRDDTADDTVIGGLTSASRWQVEQDTGLDLQTQVKDIAFDKDRLSCVRSLPLYVSPLQAVVSVTSYDQDDAATVMSSGDYYVDTNRIPGRLCLNDDASWPSDLRTFNALIVRVRSGFVGSAIALSSVTRSSTTATATAAAAHGLVTGDVGAIAGAGQAEYNALVDVTVSSTTQFTFIVSGSPATPATGTITFTPTGCPPWVKVAMQLKALSLYYGSLDESSQRLYESLVAANRVHCVGN